MALEHGRTKEPCRIASQVICSAAFTMIACCFFLLFYYTILSGIGILILDVLLDAFLGVLYTRCMTGGSTGPEKGQQTKSVHSPQAFLVSSVCEVEFPLETEQCVFSVDLLCAVDPGSAEGHGWEEVWGCGEAPRQVRLHISARRRFQCKIPSSVQSHTLCTVV